MGRTHFPAFSCGRIDALLIGMDAANPSCPHISKPFWRACAVLCKQWTENGELTAADLDRMMNKNRGGRIVMNETAYSEKARSLVRQLTLKEKVHLMGGNPGKLKFLWEALILKKYNRRPYPAGGIKNYSLPPVLFCDGPRGVVSGKSTCFPVSMARAAAWDTEMEEKIGNVIGREVRAQGGNYFGGVCINLLRHPAWGRAQETYGEDPYLLGEFGSALTKGVQKHNVMACVKHYALNSIENARFKVNVQINERTLREVYLPHFKRCIEAGAASVMGAYNKVRGVQACHNAYLLKTILKKEWGFTGFTISDFVWGVKDTVEAANGGMDIEMPITQFYGKKLIESVEKGSVKEELINESALRIVGTVLSFTEAKDPESYSKESILRKEHINLSLEAAEKSMTLLKNEDNTLPFSQEITKRCAVIGRLGSVENIGDHGSSRVWPPYTVTPLEGLRALVGDNTEVSYFDGSTIEEAKAGAADADAVVIIAGYDERDEGEYINDKYGAGGDRSSLSLRKEEIELINAVLPENKNHAVVLIGGSAIMMEEWKQSASAILMAWYGGMEGGTALARTLFGEVNPGGKLPFTIPTDNAHLPFFDKDAEEIEYGYYHGYTLFEKEGYEPAFPFGFGLSYTTFEYGSAAASVDHDTVLASVQVTNTGEIAGDEVVQVYVGFENSAVERPRKLLKGFKRLHCAPGKTQSVTIPIKINDLAWFNADKGVWEIEKMKYSLYIGPSSRKEDLLEARFTL